MTEYIERKALLEKLVERDLCLCVSESDINAIHSADVAPVRHGRWENVWAEYYSGPWHGTCSHCHVTNDIPHPRIAYYCPNCGARMDKEVADGA